MDDRHVVTEGRVVIQLGEVQISGGKDSPVLLPPASVSVGRQVHQGIDQLRETDPETADYFYDFLEISLGNTPAGQELREIMSFVSYFPGRGTVRETAYLEGKAEGKAEGRAEGKTEGRAEGEAKGILFVLEVRGIPVPDSVRERITTCTDLDRMDAWLERSRTVERAEELFAEDTDVPGPSPEQA
ncbi:hypothetical protein ACWGI9_16110 [Streptomyces sp. NPDC054833]